MSSYELTQLPKEVWWVRLLRTQTSGPARTNFPGILSYLGEQMNLKPLPDGRHELCRPQARRPETGWNHKGDAAAARDLITDPTEERPRADQALLLEHHKTPQTPPGPDTQPFIYVNILFIYSFGCLGSDLQVRDSPYLWWDLACSAQTHQLWGEGSAAPGL